MAGWDRRAEGGGGGAAAGNFTAEKRALLPAVLVDRTSHSLR